MKALLLVVMSLALTVACTKKSTEKKETQTQIKYDSPIPYVHHKMTDSEQAALVEGQPVSWSQLLSQDVALQELQEKHNQQVLGFVYAWAAMIADKKGEAQTIQFFGEKPQAELNDVLKALNISETDQVQLEMSEEIQTDGVLAKAGSESVTLDEFLAANISHAQQYEKVFKQRMQRLNGLVVRRFLLNASRDASLAMEEYVRKKILLNSPTVSTDEIEAFAQKNGLDGEALDEEMQERLKQILEHKKRDKKIEEYVAKELVKEPIQVAFSGPTMRLNVGELHESIPQWGEGNEAQLLFVGHWQCPGCPETLRSFLSTRKKWGGQLQGAFAFFFPESDREARMGAEAALCVEGQNKESFWLFLSKTLEAHQEASVEEQINQAAQESGVDFAQFRECFLKRKHQQAIDSHLRYVKSLGLTTSPLVTFQGRVLDIKNAHSIDDSLKELGLKSPQDGGIISRIKTLFGIL